MIVIKIKCGGGINQRNHIESNIKQRDQIVVNNNKRN